MGYPSFSNPRISRFFAYDFTRRGEIFAVMTETYEAFHDWGVVKSLVGCPSRTRWLASLVGLSLDFSRAWVKGPSDVLDRRGWALVLTSPLRLNKQKRHRRYI
jgi:hypothetical protein